MDGYNTWMDETCRKDNILHSSCEFHTNEKKGKKRGKNPPQKVYPMKFAAMSRSQRRSFRQTDPLREDCARAAITSSVDDLPLPDPPITASTSPTTVNLDNMPSLYMSVDVIMISSSSSL